MFLGKKENTQNEAITAQNSGPVFSNTYVVQISGLLIMRGAFKLCKTTPLPVIEKNGKKIQNANGDWIKGTHFPNSGATLMQEEYESLLPYMGKMANTIIEYLDKDTKKPVLQLFPTTMYIFDGYDEKNFASHLTPATKANFEREIALREACIDKYLAATMQNKRN